jgi:hypothetical protein
LDGEYNVSNATNNFIFYSIGVKYSLANHEYEKFIFTNERLPASHDFDWVNNKEIFCTGFNPVRYINQ